jgi:prenylcysteine oxidase/farnesylcysteine lyase
MSAGASQRLRCLHMLRLRALLLLLSALAIAEGEGPKKRVAVIGAGIGGASAGFFLHERGVEVTVFERSPAVGGRSSSAAYPLSPPSSERPQMMEMGAGILYTGNRYLYNLSLLLGLHHVPSPPRSFGLWSGDTFAFRSGSTKFSTSLGMVWRYGLSLFRLTKTVKSRLADFMRLYDVQEEGRCFENPKDLWEAVGLYNLTQTTIESYLTAQGLSRRILGELVAAVNRVNYNQNNQLNALAGVVSLCPLVTGSTFTIREGNGAIAAAMLEHAAHELVTNARVDTVVLRRDAVTGAKSYDLRITVRR